MKNTTKLLALALIGFVSACAVNGGDSSSSQQSNPLSSENASSAGDSSSNDLHSGNSSEGPSSEIDGSSVGPSSQDSSQESSSTVSSSESHSSEDAGEPNCYKFLSDLASLKEASAKGEVYMAAKDGSVYVGYTGVAKSSTPWYHEGKDLTSLSGDALSLTDGLAPLKLTFSLDSAASIYLTETKSYLWAGTSGTHSNIGFKDDATTFTFEEAGDGSFHIAGPENVYVEYYKSSFCGAAAIHKSSAKVYFLAKGYTKIDTSSSSDSSSDSSDSSLPDIVPSEYWASVDSSLRGNALRKSLQTAIKTYKTESASYSDCLELGAKAASYPKGSSRFVPFYHSAPSSGLGGELTTTTDSCNREHTWPNSRGCGKSGPGSDPFVIRPTLTSENSSRGNSFYGEESGTWDPASCGFEGARGESARVILYAATAYYGTSGNGGKPFELVDKRSDDPDNHTMGRLSTLLEWNRLYKPNAIEIQINDYLCSKGYGRNPFVDDPSYADLIWSNSGIRA